MKKIEGTFYIDGKQMALTQDCKIEIKHDKNEKYFKKQFPFLDGLSFSGYARISDYFRYSMMGYKIIESKLMVDQKQNKTHRKKRINKKWAKKYGHTSTPKKDVYVVGDTIIGHPIVIAKMKKLR